MSIELPEFNFIPPPEAPVFKPTWEEFQDALGYINKIRPIAEQTGICKIVPPPDWQPPFAVDVDNFKFTPRIQRLNELEAHTRIKLNFLDQIAKFWELQGSSLKIPVVERKALDLYTLHQNVQSEGGLECVNREKKWTKIQLKMGYPSLKNLGPFLKGHYERIIHPFHIFNNGKSFSVKREVKREEDKESAVDKDYKPHKIPSRMAGKIPDSEKNGRRSRRHPPENQGGGESKTDSEVDEDGKGNKELKRLQFYGAGPKMAGFDSDGPTSGGGGGGGAVTEEKSKTRGKKIEYYDYDPLAKYICLNCGRGDAEDQMLLCDGCDDSYHTFCLVPRLPDIPKGDWRCPKCVAVEVSKPVEAFGFEQAQKEYTLQSFGEMADKFKQDYFNMPVHLVPLEVAEKEFWRVVSSIDEDVTVEYGADLHTMDHGSGFPTRKSKNLLPADQEYATCSWNLNNIPIVEGSVLGHINCDISGMKVPWMYVGMCFSTFCWHNEDHWSYSINYLHWGEPKTWYGVPGPLAEAFEKAMAGAAPELFNAQPDLLHQLVTIMNPNIIMKAGVPIYRTNQHAGEFVITFPRSYHAGFNQGYNFAEAVNFCSADWLSIGRECISHYSNLKRYCVFSHDELVCKMASSPDQLDLVCAAATYQDLLKMVDIEKILRKALLEYGIRNAEREAFELLPDDERQCDFCKTTCFLSAVTCGGGNCSSSEKLVCLRHYKVLCECPPESKTLRYRYTLDELPPMLAQLKVRAESFDSWAAKVKEALEAEGENKLDLPELRDLVDEAESHKFPDSELLQTLVQAVTEAEKCAAVASHLAAKKVRTRMRGSVESKAKLTVEELTLFCEQVESLACQIKEGEAVRDFLQKVLSFKEESSRLLSLVAPLEKKDDHREGDGDDNEGDDDTPDSETLSKLLETGLAFDIDLPELAQLKNKVQQLSWLEETEENMEDTETLTVEAIRKLLEAGVNLPPSPKIERLMAELQALLTKAEQWEEMASKKLAGSLTIEEGQALLEEGEGIPAHMNAMTTLKDALKKSREWVTKVEAFQESEHAPLLELVETVVTKGRSIPFRLVQFSSLEENVSNAHAWLDKTARTFLKKTSHLTLLEVLLPRADIGLVSAKRKKVKKDELSPQQQLAQLLDMAVEGTTDPAAVVKAYKECEERELRAMRAIRAHNKNKSKFDDLSTFCICHRASHGAMNTCTLCCNQFHVGCIPMYHRNKMKMGSEGRFICISCERSKRPRLEMILSLLVSLQRIPIRLPEAEALQCLTERAMLWQDRARTLLQVGEVATSMAKLTSISEQMVEAKEAEENGVDGGENNRGAYDAVLNDFLSGHTPLVSLSPGVKQQVQDLLVEGELLEVFLDECCHLWRLLQAVSHPPAHMEEVLLGMAVVASADGSPPAGESSAKPPRKSIQQKRRSNSGSEQPSSSSSALLDQTSFSSSSRSPAKKMRPTSAADKSSLLLLGGKGLFPPGSVMKKKASSSGGVKQSSVVASGSNNNNGVKSSSTVRRPNTSAPKSHKGGNTSSHHADAPWLLTEEGSSDDESADESADEECAMRGCMRPYGSNVQWVQCDGCDLWFHYVCVGLCQKDISEDEEYLCASCCPSAVPAPPFKDLCPP